MGNEQEFILKKIKINGSIKIITERLQMISRMAENAKTYDDLNNVENFFKTTIDNCAKELNNGNDKIR